MRNDDKNEIVNWWKDQLLIWFESTIPASQIPAASKIRIAIYRKTTQHNTFSHPSADKKTANKDVKSQANDDKDKSDDMKVQNKKKANESQTKMLGPAMRMDASEQSLLNGATAKDVAIRLLHAEHIARSELSMVAAVYLPLVELRQKETVRRYVPRIPHHNSAVDFNLRSLSRFEGKCIVCIDGCHE